jgi:polyphosphate kinase
MKAHRKYINRELSWLEFNQRVLQQACWKSTPLLERVKFLAITASNLDEFFMVRVGGLKMENKLNPAKVDNSGMTPLQQLEAVRERVQQMNADQSECLLDNLESSLAEEGIVRVRPDELNQTQREHVNEYFTQEMEAALAPISVTGADDFPFLRGARLCLCVRLKSNAADVLGGQAEESLERFALIPMSNAIPRMISLPSESGFQYMLVEDLVGLFLHKFFEGQEVLGYSPFRVTRSADVSLDEDGDRDFLAEMQDMLDNRTRAECVRLEIQNDASPEIRQFLLEANEAAGNELYAIRGPLDLSAYFFISGLAKFQHLKDEPWPAHPCPDFALEDDMFEVISAGDRLLSHPYQHYDPVVRFVQNAADDPDVIAIKQTLYRTARDSQIVNALVDAAENGKHVTAIVELKARFDEARNIQWAKRLERAGVDVIYGVRGLKTHAKMCVVVRREAGGVKRYMHFGTGNYNESTAALYSDISLFTCDPQLGVDVIHAFNAVTGLSVPQRLEKLSLAPVNLRERLLELIHFETENAKRDLPAVITLKCNSLVDLEMINALYEASQAGVKVRLNVRGICCLRPGVKGLSKNIKVVSVVDRYLEHARIYHFHQGGDQAIMIASADIMPRNLDRRVELMVPLDDGECKNRLLKILETYFDGNVAAWDLDSDGEFTRRKPKSKKKKFRVQEALYLESNEVFSAHTNPRTTVFQAHRGGAS